MGDAAAYAQGKLTLTMWTRALAEADDSSRHIFVAVNPGSLLGSKMVKEGFGIVGKSQSIGADVLVRATLSEEFSGASGRYFDNNEGRFGSPHPDTLGTKECQTVVNAIEEVIASY